MAEEEEGGGKKEPLWVEGVDINAVSHPGLLKHVSEMVESLVVERAERGRAQAEADMARTAWENAERSLAEAECRLVRLRLQAEGAAVPQQRPQRILLPDTSYRQDQLQARVQRMIEELPKEFDKSPSGVEEWGAEDASREVVAAIDRHLAFAEDHLQRVLRGQRSAVQRERYLRTFLQVQRAQVEAEKNRLVHHLGQVHEDHLADMKSFFKRTIQNDLFLMLSLKERIAGLRSARDQKKRAVAVAQKGIFALRNEMKELLGQIEKGYRSAKIYESNRNLLEKYERLIRKEELEAGELRRRREAAGDRLEAAQVSRRQCLEKMERAASQREEILDRFRQTDVFSGLDGDFERLLGAAEAVEGVERSAPGEAARLRSEVDGERRAVRRLEGTVLEQAGLTRELVRAAEDALPSTHKFQAKMHE